MPDAYADQQRAGFESKTTEEQRLLLLIFDCRLAAATEAEATDSHHQGNKGARRRRLSLGIELEVQMRRLSLRIELEVQMRNNSSVEGLGT